MSVSVLLSTGDLLSRSSAEGSGSSPQRKTFLAQNGLFLVPLDVVSPKREAEITGRVFLRLSYIDAMEAVGLNIREAAQGVQRSRIAQSADASNIVQSIGGGAAQMGSLDKLYKAVGELLQRLEVFERVIDTLSELHPFFNIAWSLTSALYKAVKEVFEADKKVIDLVRTMSEAFLILCGIQTLRDRAIRLQRSIDGLLKQTIECCIFVRKYTSRGFAGRMLDFNSSQKIDEFGQVFDHSTIAQHFRDMSRLGAFLFFERGKSEPSSVMRTIAYKLGIFDSSIGSSILSAIEDDQDIATASSMHQFKTLLLQPLVASMSGPIVIVLDALDECGTPDSRRGLMDLLREFSEVPSIFRFLITSRRESDIDKILSSQPDHVRAMELDRTSKVSQEDVLIYLRTEMHRAVREDVEIPKGYPWEANVALLGKAAGGLFIWASTAVKMVENSNTKLDRLEHLVSDSRSLSGFGLDVLYAAVLSVSGIKWSDEGSKELFRKVLALVLLSKVPVSSGDIDGILGLSPQRSSILILQNLRSVLTYNPGGPVSLFHTSFSDYLMSPERSNDLWFIDISKAKGLIIDRCFLVMKDLLRLSICDLESSFVRNDDVLDLVDRIKSQIPSHLEYDLLRFNICDLESSFVRNDDVLDLADRIKSQIPSCLEYACLHWAQHLLDASSYSSDLHGRLSYFAYRRLLFWFEVLSLLKLFGRVATCSLREAMATWIVSYDASLASFFQDASRLASMFSTPIMQSTPHVYISMLPFWGDDSEFVAHYSKCMASMVRVERRGAKRPPLCLKVLDGHSEWVNSVAFSLHGMRVASACYDNTVLVRDIDSGEVIYGPLEGITAWFSPDGSHFVSGSQDGTVRVWDARDGALILGPLKGHTSWAYSVTWSPDGTRIASGSRDETIIIWDAADGRATYI
ncbi:WD40 repeat-like protein [Sanghuangporus baumii]|uniref:WD40 repeat-like protein n=1 Tax=Sanghuangporus baumii TaxID=108892 RepID=A0A9Q5HYC9_SANBA|nr:WD40 repeat-like protein [Sanghuangporus baumii]